MASLEAEIDAAKVSGTDRRAAATAHSAFCCTPVCAEAALPCLWYGTPQAVAVLPLGVKLVLSVPVLVTGSVVTAAGWCSIGMLPWRTCATCSLMKMHGRSWQPSPGRCVVVSQQGDRCCCCLPGLCCRVAFAGLVVALLRSWERGALLVRVAVI